MHVRGGATEQPTPPAEASQPEQPAPPASAAAPMRSIRPRKRIRFVEDLADSRPEPQTPELPPPPAVPEPEHTEPQGATFTPVPDGYYFDPDSFELRPWIISAEQDSMPTPSYDGNVDGLVVMRDVVQKLRAAAIAEKTGRAWAMYHREAKRLAMIERRYLARAIPKNAPPLHAQAKRSNGTQNRNTGSRSNVIQTDPIVTQPKLRQLSMTKALANMG